ncbi:hypothetical protein BDZ85DRAFT_49020 [Elsinoe ampelina]|uniref:polynucleotide adenylyltransferase n=1 Tax=Elsinoe ampelina TaxID=302913 RepID=A0A6A6GLW6_9PEZI|nr:hypothetical protein BDZ85DRAFT_49020 [Elsinoe ampelina]
MSHNERRRPPSPRQDTFRFGGQNSHQNFDFVGPNGNGPSFPSTSGQNRDRFRGRERSRGNFRGRGRGSWKRFNASDREIFRARRSPTPERMAGMNGSDSRFRVLEDLPESESESDPDNVGLYQLDGTGASRDNLHSDDMDMSSEDEHPRAKRARTTNGASTDTGDVKPKWSNPDPYTALPPPSQTDGPKKDVVAMIRKAKVENAGSSEQTSKADDFISLNFDDAGNEREEGEDSSDSDHQLSEVHDRASNRPRGQRTDHNGPARSTNTATDRWPAQEATHTYFDRHEQDMQRRSRSPARDYDRDYNAHQSRREYRADRAYDTRDMYDEYPVRYNAHAPPAQYDDDDDYAPPPARPYNNGYSQPQASQPAAGKRKRREGANDVSGGYLPAAYSDNTPWMSYCQVQSSSIGEWLHDEIRAFHEYVRPRTYERTMREELIKRVNDAFKLKYHHVTVHPFGSFATDLYLPVSDMDLVAVTTTYMQSGYPEIGQSKKDVRAINGTVIERGGLSRSSQLILGAKVPIIKFTDIPTGIHVDVSFENDSGLRAVPVVEEWIRRYPSIPHLVYPIKHLLASHDLNDVSTGGLGGFSIICLVVYSLHHLEGRHSRDFIFDNLEVALMNFLGYFGNEFDYRLQGLDMGNMRKIQKISFRGDRRPQPQRLLIVDPNNPANDVSGGTGKIPAIFRLFSETHKRLRSQMELAGALHRETGQRPSILKSMLDSGFDSYEYQRGRLRQRYDQLYG